MAAKISINYCLDNIMMFYLIDKN